MDAKRLNLKFVTRWGAVAAAIVFFALTAWLGRPPGTHWNSPDEMANAFWIKRVAAGLPLAVQDAAVGLGAGAVHPRSFSVLGDALVPGSFPGLFLIYGAIHGMTQVPLWVLTPFFTALAALALHGVLKRRDERWAFWATLLFLTNPAVIYYASRGLYPNLLVIDFLIIAFWFLTARPLAEPRIDRVKLDEIIAGLLVGAALVTRLAELPWIAIGVVLWLWVARIRRPGPTSATEASPTGEPSLRLGQLPLSAAGPSGSPADCSPHTRPLWFLVALAVPLILYGLYNFSVYGAPWRLGYVLVPASVATSAGGTSLPTASLLPFGFHPRLVLANVWNYGLMFWYLTLPALAALAWFFAGWKNRSRVDRALAVFFAATAGWVAVFYGSWLIHDRFNPADVTIGTSYVRYFLPALVLASIFAARGLSELTIRLGKLKWILPVAGLLVVGLSLHAAVWRGDESLLAVRRTLATNEDKSKAIVAVIPPNSVIITERFDKLIFPERMRFIPNLDAGSLSRLRPLTAVGPVVYYGLDSDDGWQVVLAAAETAGMSVAKWTSPVPGESLWAVVSRTSKP